MKNNVENESRFSEVCGIFVIQKTEYIDHNMCIL